MASTEQITRPVERIQWDLEDGKAVVEWSDGEVTMWVEHDTGEGGKVYGWLKVHDLDRFKHAYLLLMSGSIVNGRV